MDAGVKSTRAGQRLVDRLISNWHMAAGQLAVFQPYASYICDDALLIEKNLHITLVAHPDRSISLEKQLSSRRLEFSPMEGGVTV